jgi:DNA-binding IclR family transcriptional regulator
MPQRRDEDRAASSLERLIGVLDLFEKETRPLSFDEIHSKLGYTRSTLYRYLKILADAEILTSFPGLGYSLGPRITELDYTMRARDPLIVASRPVMAELVAEIPGIALLCRKYRDKVLCVHQEQTDVAFASSYERGRALPLLRGAASRIILAYLHSAKVSRLYAERRHEFLEAGLGRSEKELRAILKKIRSDGFDMTTEQVTAGVTGIAAPIFDAQNSVLGSISVTIQRRQITNSELHRIADRVMFGSRIITGAIAQSSVAK